MENSMHQNTEKIVKEISNQVTTYFGKGEYAITSKNAGNLAEAVHQYRNDGGWKWALQDCLGIKIDGTLSPRFDNILASSQVPSELKQAMRLTKATLRTPDQIYRLHARRIT